MISCSSPGCGKQFHVGCTGQGRSSDKDLNGFFFVCLRCETFLQYSAEIAKKSFLADFECRLSLLEKSIHEKVEERIRYERERTTQELEAHFKSIVSQIEGRIEAIQTQSTKTCDQLLDKLKEKEEHMESIRLNLQTMQSEVSQLKDTSALIKGQITSFKSNTRKESFIIRNLPETNFTVKDKTVSSCLGAVSAISSVLGLSQETLDQVKDAYRIGKARADGKPRLVMVKAPEKIVKEFLFKSRLLKHADRPLCSVFIQENLPPELVEKLATMRKRAYDHRINFPHEEAFVKGNKLFINGNIIDEFKSNF